MKSILKFLPVALGVLTMASCSDEDFVGSETQKHGKELIPTVENLVNADGGTTRSAWTAGGTYQVSWSNGDQFRVYDEAVQAYDIFTRKAAGITIDGTADVAAHKYAIFPGNKVSYAGWDKANGLSAVMKIEPAWNYGGAGKVTFGDELKTVYASDLPMWGAVTNETSENLEVDLKFLSSVLDVCIYQGAAQKIRVVAFKNESAKTTDATIDPVKLASETGEETPLSGYFFAQLKDEGQLVKDMTQPTEMKGQYGYKLEVTVPQSAGEEVHLLIPVIPATYKYLSVQKLTGGTWNEPTQNYTGGTWEEVKGYPNTEIKRGQVRKTGLEIGVKPTVTTIQVSSLADLNTKLQTAADLNSRIINVELKSGGSLATANTATPAEYSLVIPNVDKDLTININAAIASSAKQLVISGGNATKTATLNIIGGVTGDKGVHVSTVGAVKLGGNYAGNMTITSDKDVTLGLGLESSFTTSNVVKNHADGNVIVDANEGTITDISLNADTDVNGITVNSGTVTTIGKAKAAKGAVTINGGTLTTINTTTGAITVNGGTATNLVTTTGDLIIGEDSEVSTVTTSATTFTAATDLKKLTISGEAGSTVNLTVADATIDEIEAANRADAATSTLNIMSTGHASIKKVTNNNGTRTTINYGTASAWDGKAAAEATADANGVIPVYTVGQLASVTAGKKYKLMAASYNINGKKWTPVNVSADFDGNSKTIIGLTNSLFATISGGTIKSMILDEVANATAANTGALAQTVTGSPTIKNIEVKATTASTIGADTGTANSKNIGGLVGTVNGTTVNFIDNKVTATVKGYANVGGLIGNVAGGTVNIKTTVATDAFKSDVTFNKNYKPEIADNKSDANCGTFGNLIGSITGTGVTVFVGKEGTTAAAGNVATNFFKDNISTKTSKDQADPTKLDFALNRTFNGTTIAKEFKGTKDPVVAGDTAFENAIGYSTGTITKLTMFNKTENSLGFDWTINDINVFVAP